MRNNYQACEKENPTTFLATGGFFLLCGVKWETI